MDEIDTAQTQATLTSLRIQVNNLPLDQMQNRAVLEQEILRLEHLITPPPPPAPTAPDQILPPEYRTTRVQIDKTLNPDWFAKAYEQHNHALVDADQEEITQEQFIKLRHGQLKLYFRAYRYCGGFFAAPPKGHARWDEFVAAVEQSVIDDPHLWDPAKVE